MDRPQIRGRLKVSASQAKTSMSVMEFSMSRGLDVNDLAQVIMKDPRVPKPKEKWSDTLLGIVLDQQFPTDYLEAAAQAMMSVFSSADSQTDTQPVEGEVIYGEKTPGYAFEWLDLDEGSDAADVDATPTPGQGVADYPQPKTSALQWDPTSALARPGSTPRPRWQHADA